jgi:ketosteroid isomerase-like protein
MPVAAVSLAAVSLADAEVAFALQSVREDMRAAFMAHFAPDGVFVRDGWELAVPWLAQRPAPAIVLDWRPVHVEVSASEDLGLSTGPWRMSPRGEPDAPVAYGQYVSIWKCQGAGPWQVAVDVGIAHPRPSLWDAPLVARAVAGAKGPGEDLAPAEARFSRMSAEGGSLAAYRALGADDLRLYREELEPAASLEAALEQPGLTAERREWHPEAVAVARSRDLGYARGWYAAAGGTRPAGHYLRVWRRGPQGWRIALDVVNALAVP